MPKERNLSEGTHEEDEGEVDTFTEQSYDLQMVLVHVLHMLRKKLLKIDALVPFLERERGVYVWSPRQSRPGRLVCTCTCTCTSVVPLFGRLNSTTHMRVRAMFSKRDLVVYTLAGLRV